MGEVDVVDFVRFARDCHISNIPMTRSQRVLLWISNFRARVATDISAVKRLRVDILIILHNEQTASALMQTRHPFITKLFERAWHQLQRSTIHIHIA